MCPELPPELIQLVLYHSTTPTYMSLALSCHSLFEIASACREVILHHLRRTPGLSLGIESWSTKGLFRLLIKRSFQQLYGAEFYASRKLFCSETQAIDARTCSFSFVDDSNLALVFKDRESVHLVHAQGNGNIIPTAHLRSPWGKAGRVEVLKTAFDERGRVYVLQRFLPPVPSNTTTTDQDGSDTEHPFVKHAVQSGSSRTTYLAQYLGSSDSDSHSGMRICAFPDNTDYEPLGLAVAGEESFAILWQHVTEVNHNEVVLYTTLQESMDDNGIMKFGYTARAIKEGHDSDKGPIVDLTFNDRASQLLYYYRGQTLYGTFQKIVERPEWIQRVQLQVYRNSCPVEIPNFSRLRFSIDIPFFGTHEAVNLSIPQMCHWKYLAFGIGSNDDENWTAAYLLVSEAYCRASRCGHELNLDRGRRFSNWTVVGQLLGFQDSTNSLGCIVAASKRGTRLAVANWTVIRIWALEPNALIDGNATGFYPRCLQSGDSGMVYLPSVTLQLGAVCFKLRFMDHDENKLLAITDRGLMYWDLGPLSKGERTVCTLNI